MGSVQSPLVGLEMLPETATYVGLLEAKLCAYAVQEAKFRALLELITGESWESTRLGEDSAALQALAVDALVKSTGATVASAKAYVSLNWNRLNQVETTPVAQAVPIEEMVQQIQSQTPADVPVTPPVMSMTDRLRAWKAAQSESLATETAAAESSSPVTEEVPQTPS